MVVNFIYVQFCEGFKKDQDANFRDFPEFS